MVVHTNKMPRLPPPQTTEPSRSVGFVSNEWREQGVAHLSNQHQIARQVIIKVHHLMEVDNQIAEPYRGCKVIQDMTYTEAKSLGQW